jgi:Family of unknown function (DUF5692)
MSDLITNIPWFWIALAIIIIVVFGTIMSVRHKYWDIFFTFVFPIAVTTPMVFIFNRFDGFENSTFAIIKLYSVLLSAMLVWFIRYKPKTVWGRKLRVLAFSINIMEAVIVELSHGFLLNPLAGILILATIPRWETLEVEKGKLGKRKLRWNSPLVWVLAYSIWNYTFSMNLYPSLWFLNTLHILVGLALVLRDPGWYAQIRAVSLNITFSMMIAFLPAFDYVMSESDKYGTLGSVENHGLFVFINSIFALIVAIGSVVQQLIRKKGRVAGWFKLEKNTPKFSSK